MSLVYKVGTGWQFTPRSEFLGRERTNRDTTKTFHIIWNRNGNITYFSTNPPNQFNFRGAGGSTTVNTGVAADDKAAGEQADAFANFVNSQGAKNAFNYTNSFKSQIQTNTSNQNQNIASQRVNDARAQEEAVNKRDNNAERKVLQIADATQGMDYLAQRKQIEDITGIPKSIKDNALKDYKTFYSVEKLKPWDSGLGALDPLGEFDGKYYRGENTDIDKQWAQATADDDVDVLGRFGTANNLAWFDYTQYGKSKGKRGSKIRATEGTDAYVENPPTDAEAAQIRQKQLGVKDRVQTRDKFLAIPEVAEQWERAKEGTTTTDGEHWNSLASKEFFDVEDPNDFMLMFRLSQRAKDKKINKTANADLGITDLEDEVFRIETEKIGEASKKFGALARDTLKTTIAELNKAEAQNAQLEFYNTIPQVRELNGMASELANSIAGDYQAGGISPINKKQLTRDFQNLFGTNNNVTYNWQKFFDEKIADKYQEDMTFEDPETAESIKVEKEFAQAYVKDFLKPRFDTSRSMDEFESYVGERQAKQNPFDLQDYRTASRELANTEAEKFITQAQGEAARNFNADFYFDPKGRKDSALYATQKTKVNADWDTAKADPDALIDKPLADGGRGTWAQQAYKYGIDINDKAQFGRMHYQIVGQGQGFDGADDIINATKVQNKVDDIATALEKKEITEKFSKFETPQELADEVIRKLPTGDAEYKERLSELGYADFEGDSTQLRELLINDAAKDEGLQIRRKLKYLQDEGALPTQQELGYSYIERDEDIKQGTGGTKQTASTPLFEAFLQAGFQGTEDDFYDNFMTGTSRADQELAYQISKGNPLKFGDRLTEDIGSYSRLLDTPEERGAREAKNAKTYKSYFDTYEGDDYRKYSKKKGRSFLDEYKDLFDTSSFSFSSDF